MLSVEIFNILNMLAASQQLDRRESARIKNTPPRAKDIEFEVNAVAEFAIWRLEKFRSPDFHCRKIWTPKCWDKPGFRTRG
jgi:hypothetical protein